MKRKTAVCKCGRTVVARSFIYEETNPYTGGVRLDGWRYYIWCPSCALTTSEYKSPTAAWVEWERLTTFICQTCDEHGTPNWPPRKLGTVTITGEEWEAMRGLLLEIEPRQTSPKLEPWRKLWRLAYDWLAQIVVNEGRER